MWRSAFNKFSKLRPLSACSQCKQVCGINSDVAEEHIAQATDVTKQTRRKINKRLSEEKKSNILNFFNNCDHVTLKKLINQKPAYFKNLDPISIIQTGITGQRFQDVEHLVKVADINPAKMSEISRLVQVLKKAEDTNFGVRFMSPAFPVEKIPDVDRVAALNMFQNRLCWVVQSRNREVTDVGTLMFEANAFYGDTARHQDECLRMLSTVPHADVYLTMLLRPPVKLNRNPQYVISQGIMESLIIALLNLRQTGYIKHLPKQPYTGQDNAGLAYETSDISAKYEIADSLYSEPEELNTDIQRTTTAEQFQQSSEPCEETVTPEFVEWDHRPLFTDTSVFVVKLQAFQDFYDVTFMNELLECLPLVDLSTDFENQKGPLQGVQFHDDVIEKIREMAEKEQIARCLLMADMFCRSLQKSSAFPRAYS